MLEYYQTKYISWCFRGQGSLEVAQSFSLVLVLFDSHQVVSELGFHFLARNC
jgi:hypothetical protein